jgi:hypothetical protein
MVRRVELEGWTLAAAAEAAQGLAVTGNASSSSISPSLTSASGSRPFPAQGLAQARVSAGRTARFLELRELASIRGRLGVQRQAFRRNRRGDEGCWMPRAIWTVSVAFGLVDIPVPGL